MSMMSVKLFSVFASYKIVIFLACEKMKLYKLLRIYDLGFGKHFTIIYLSNTSQ